MIIVAMFVFNRSENEHIQLMDSIHSFHSRNMPAPYRFATSHHLSRVISGAVESYESDNFDTIIFLTTNFFNKKSIQIFLTT